MGLIRGLTLIRPWGWAIACGGKDVENRTWNPPRSMLGQYVAIHSGQKYDEDAALWIEMEAKPLGLRVPNIDDDPAGCIVAVARLAGVQTAALGNPWFVGPIGWQLRDVVRIEPVPCKGAQGLWPVPPDVLAIVRERWRNAHGTALASA